MFVENQGEHIMAKKDTLFFPENEVIEWLTRNRPEMVKLFSQAVVR
jgi:hypothetical protein